MSCEPVFPVGMKLSTPKEHNVLSLYNWIYGNSSANNPNAILAPRCLKPVGSFKYSSLLRSLRSIHQILGSENNAMKVNAHVKNTILDIFNKICKSICLAGENTILYRATLNKFQDRDASIIAATDNINLAYLYYLRELKRYNSSQERSYQNIGIIENHPVILEIKVKEFSPMLHLGGPNHEYLLLPGTFINIEKKTPPIISKALTMLQNQCPNVNQGILENQPKTINYKTCFYVPDENVLTYCNNIPTENMKKIADALGIKNAKKLSRANLYK